MAFDTGLYLTIAARLCTAPVLPYEFVTAARDFRKLLDDLNDVAASHLDLAPAMAAAEGFEAAAERLQEARSRAAGEKARVLNNGIMHLSRIINPILYTVAGDYEQDPALQVPMLPGLDAVRKLARLDPAGSDYRFLRTRLVRERNRTEDALYRATAEVDRLLRELG